MAAGNYRHRITIYAPAPTVSDGMGGRKPAGPEPSLETWAAVQVLQARSFFEGGKLYDKQPYRVTLRYVNDPALQFAHRVEWNGTQITLASVAPDAKKTTLTLFGYGS